MVYCLDSGIGNVTKALKRRGMWDKTLVVFSSDNGGREDEDFGGNNYPLRGMKFTDFEGGVRVASFASGGVLPKKRRGVTEAGLIHICDWYATFCSLAGVDATDHKAAAADLPAIDSLDMWPVLQGGASPRTEIGLSSNAVIAWLHKLVLKQRKGWWTSPMHPNSTIPENSALVCQESGCVFDISQDPEERKDLATSSPTLLRSLTALLAKYVASSYQTNDIPGFDNCTTIQAYVLAHRGFGGPLCYNGSIPDGPGGLVLPAMEYSQWV